MIILPNNSPSLRSGLLSLRSFSPSLRSGLLSLRSFSPSLRSGLFFCSRFARSGVHSLGGQAPFARSQPPSQGATPPSGGFVSGVRYAHIHFVLSPSFPGLRPSHSVVRMSLAILRSTYGPPGLRQGEGSLRSLLFYGPTTHSPYGATPLQGRSLGPLRAGGLRPYGPTALRHVGQGYALAGG